MEVRLLQVQHENEAHCLYWIHVSVLVSGRASPANKCFSIKFEPACSFSVGSSMFRCVLNRCTLYN